MTTRLKKVTLGIALALYAVPYSAIAGFSSPFSPFGESGKSQTIFEQLSKGGEVLEATIRTDLAELIDNRRREDYQPAELIVKNEFGKEDKWAVEVKPRGKFRRRVCDFPPFTLKFPKETLTLHGFNRDYNKLKLVTHCIEDKFPGEENLLKEFLTYRLYNELTPKSYRVRLVRITYVDSKGKISKFKRNAFFIEDTDEMAHRLGGIENETMNQGPDVVSAHDENLMALFQYMIGNEDWSAQMLRNVKLVKPDNGGRMILVPFDFDFAGLINTSYAIPNVDYGLTSVRQRAYIGWEAPDDIFQATIQTFLNKKQKLIAIVDDFDHLSRAGRKDVIQYMESFYMQIEVLLAEDNRNIHQRLKEASVVSSPEVN
jgi:hypothetical protein